MGVTAKFEHPAFCATMEKLRTLAADKSIPAGVHVVAPSPEQLRQRLDEGYRFLAYSIDAVMLQSVVSPF